MFLRAMTVYDAVIPAMLGYGLKETLLRHVEPQEERSVHAPAPTVHVTVN